VRRETVKARGLQYVPYYSPARGRPAGYRPVELRNGLPEPRPYVYRGTGRDQCPETAAWTQRGGYRPRENDPGWGQRGDGRKHRKGAGGAKSLCPGTTASPILSTGKGARSAAMRP